MSAETDMENRAVLAERYAGIMAQQIARLIEHIDADTEATQTTRECVDDILATAEAALSRLRNACAARHERNGRRNAA